MSNFTKQLAKGFVRSAVNQVGRDGGKVISNNIYNDQNYIPVSDMTSYGESTAVSNQSGIPQEAISKTKHFTAGKMVFLSIISIVLMPVGSLCVLLYGLFMLIDQSDKVEWYTTESQYVRDRRYRTGSRYVGKIATKHSAKVAATPDIISIKKRNAKIAMIIGGIGILLFTLIMVFA